MELNAENLKQTLWSNIKKLESGEMQCDQANAAASQVREILKTISTELQISKQAGSAVTKDLRTFANCN